MLIFIPNTYTFGFCRNATSEAIILPDVIFLIVIQRLLSCFHDLGQTVYHPPYALITVWTDIEVFIRDQVQVISQMPLPFIFETNMAADESNSTGPDTSTREFLIPL